MTRAASRSGAHARSSRLGVSGSSVALRRPKSRRATVREAYEPLINEESDKLLDQDAIVQEAIRQVEDNGIVFLDEIDKIAGREGRVGADVSREGLQRDLLPLI